MTSADRTSNNYIIKQIYKYNKDIFNINEFDLNTDNLMTKKEKINKKIDFINTLLTTFSKDSISRKWFLDIYANNYTNICKNLL
jgi:hypothetical protein